MLYPISQIKVGKRRRKLGDVSQLAGSIAEVGLLNPITITANGALLAGYHRLEACKSLGWTEIEVNTVNLDGLLAELVEIDENLHRNELTYLERSEHLARRKEIYETLYPETKHGGDHKSEDARSNGNNFHLIPSFAEDAAIRIGVTPRTIRQEIQIAKDLTDEVKDLVRLTALADSKTELSALARIDPTDQIRVAQKVLAREVPNVRQAARLVHREDRIDQLAHGNGSADTTPGAKVLCGDFRTALNEVPDNSVSLVFTDPPYDKPSLPVYQDLALIANRILKPGGSLIAYTGHYALPEILSLMCPHLRYWWLLCVKHTGGSTGLEGKGVLVTWKPMVWFVKDKRGHENYVEDSVASEPPDKNLHEWQQATKEASYYIERLTLPGELVLDPFCGSGTTLIAALQLGRKSIGVEIQADRAAVARGRIYEFTRSRT